MPNTPDNIQFSPGQRCAHLVEENGVVRCDYTSSQQIRRGEDFSEIRENCPKNIQPYTGRDCRLKTGTLPWGAAFSMANRKARTAEPTEKNK